MSRRSEAPSAVRVFGDFPAVDLSDGGPFTASRDSCPGADAKFLAGFMAKNFVAGASHPGQMEREEVTSAPRKVHSGKQAAGVAAGGKTAAPSGAVSSHTVRCAGSAGHGATEEKRRHNNGMSWSLAHHSRTGENRENRTTSITKKSEISSLFYTYLSR
ncbi:hypothetical protein DQW51_17310 [Escherichia coli O111:H-]|nr:hypothetical protein DQW51_17310 [Escherichia coli O111:H-]